MQLINEALETIRVGEPRQHLNLVVYPLLHEAANVADYVTLDEALAAGTCRITEVSEAGSVPELSFENLSEKPVLLLDGEELVGAKQNRVLNLTILVAGQLKIKIPVSCVEQGRWRFRSKHFSSGGKKMYAKARAMKLSSVSESMRSDGSRRSDQSRIWDEISRKSARMSVRSETGASEAIYDQSQAALDGFHSAFSVQPGQIGAVFAINGEIVGLDLFDATETFAKIMRKLVESYALDAIDVGEPKLQVVPVGIVRTFLQQVAHSRPRSFKAVGEGNDLRLESSDVVGAGLEADGRLVHLTAFNAKQARDDDQESDSVLRTLRH
jgi:hypothetical protein